VTALILGRRSAAAAVAAAHKSVQMAIRISALSATVLICDALF